MYALTVVSDTESRSLPGALEALDIALNLSAPEIAAALRPGLTSDEFGVIAATLSVETPGDVRTLYQWHDGSEVVHAGDRAQLFPGGQMLPFDEVRRSIRDAMEASSRDGDSFWNPTWLPIFTDNLGGWHVVTCGEGPHRVLAISLVDLPDTETAYLDVQQMIVALERRWRTGAYKQGPWGGVNADIRQVASLYREEDAAPPDLDQLLNDLDVGSLENYTNALSRLRTRLYPEAVPGLIRILRDGTPRGRKSASELLGAIGDVLAVPALEHAARSDPDPLIRIYAGKSLEQLENLA